MKLPDVNVLLYAMNVEAAEHRQAREWLEEALAGAGTVAAGNLTTDAHLAALAIEHGATLATFDGDFQRFSELRVEYLR